MQANRLEFYELGIGDPIAISSGHGLGMGDLGVDGTTFNEIQTLRLNADAGTFDLEINADGIIEQAAGLTSNITATELQAALQNMLVTAYELDPATSGQVVDVVQNDDVFVIRFIGLLSNTDVASITSPFDNLTIQVEEAGGNVLPAG